MTTALNRLADGTVELTINIPWPKVKAEYEKVVQAAVEKAEVKGFRKGKAPRDLVEKQLDKNKLYEEVIRLLLPTVYTEAAKEHQLKPIVSPHIKVLSLEENKDWQIQAITSELPTVELGDYQKTLRHEMAAGKIIVPGKKEEPEKEDQQLTKIFQILLKTAKLILPQILVEDEVNRMLARLIDQTNKLGLTVEQYLSSIGKTTEQLRTEYTQQAQETLKLELILSKIADEEKIQIDESEIDKMIAAAPDEGSRSQMEKPEQRLYLKQLLRKQKVVEKLLKI
ncbi:MAG: trigger factor [Candidatus Shapirobacteria bacterium]